MKKFINIILAFCLLFTIQNASAQGNKAVTTKFWVAGICGMCEETIERTMDTKGVITADFDLETNQLTVTYKPNRVTEDHLHELLNEAGYDTQKRICTEEQYRRVHGCCQYREDVKH